LFKTNYIDTKTCFSPTCPKWMRNSENMYTYELNYNKSVDYNANYYRKREKYR